MNYISLKYYFISSYIVGVLDPYSMTLIKRDRAIDIKEPSVGAILQSGNNFNSLDNKFVDDNRKQNSDDQEPEKVFPIGHGKRIEKNELLFLRLKLVHY